MHNWSRDIRVRQIGARRDISSNTVQKLASKASEVIEGKEKDGSFADRNWGGRMEHACCLRGQAPGLEGTLHK